MNTTCNKIFLDSPNVGDLEKKYLAEAIDSSYVSTFGPYVEKFEKKVANYLGLSTAVSVQSGTSAIYMALYSLGIGAGDEVIVPALTFVASVNPVLYVGATPVFVDVDKNSWNIDPKEIEKKISSKTKAIIPVHFYGNPCDMDKIIDIANKYNLAIIEDAAESLGATYKEQYTGTFGDFGCFSFNGNKIITTGGGGLVVGKDINKLKYIKFLVNQARDEEKGYFHPELGFNFRMTNLEASLGLAQFERLEEFLDKKRKFNKIYRQELADIDFIKFQECYDGVESSYWLNSIIFDRDIDINELQKKLKDYDIPTRRIFMPITEFPYFDVKNKEEYKNSYYVYGHGLCLPSSTLNTEEQIIYIANKLKEILL